MGISRKRLTTVKHLILGGVKHLFSRRIKRVAPSLSLDNSLFLPGTPVEIRGREKENNINTCFYGQYT